MSYDIVQVAKCIVAHNTIRASKAQVGQHVLHKPEENKRLCEGL